MTDWALENLSTIVHRAVDGFDDPHRGWAQVLGWPVEQVEANPAHARTLATAAIARNAITEHLGQTAPANGEAQAAPGPLAPSDRRSAPAGASAANFDDAAAALRWRASQGPERSDPIAQLPEEQRGAAADFVNRAMAEARGARLFTASPSRPEPSRTPAAGPTAMAGPHGVPYAALDRSGGRALTNQIASAQGPARAEPRPAAAEPSIANEMYAVRDPDSLEGILRGQQSDFGSRSDGVPIPGGQAGEDSDPNLRKASLSGIIKALEPFGDEAYAVYRGADLINKVRAYAKETVVWPPDRQAAIIDPPTGIKLENFPSFHTKPRDENERSATVLNQDGKPIGRVYVYDSGFTYVSNKDSKETVYPPPDLPQLWNQQDGLIHQRALAYIRRVDKAGPKIASALTGLVGFGAGKVLGPAFGAAFRGSKWADKHSAPHINHPKDDEQAWAVEAALEVRLDEIRARGERRPAPPPLPQHGRGPEGFKF